MEKVYRAELQELGKCRKPRGILKQGEAEAAVTALSIWASSRKEIMSMNRDQP